jgi:acyl-CoA-binding protein
MKKTIYISYQETCCGGEICKGHEEDPYPSHENEECDFWISGAYWSRPCGMGSAHNDPYYEEMEVEVTPENWVAPEVYILVVQYGTGDTFGHTSGRGAIEGVYAYEADAKLDARKIECDNEDDGQRFESPHGYKRWIGYFESLEDVRIVRVPVQP